MREIITENIKVGEHVLIDGVEYATEAYDSNCSECALYQSGNCGFINCNGVIFKKVNKESKYRHYKDQEEMVEDWKERFMVDEIPDFCMPMIWVKDKSAIIESTYLITEYCEKVVRTGDSISNFRGLFDNYTYLDGSPCGKEIE